jgi:hypothetical protein
MPDLIEGRARKTAFPGNNGIRGMPPGPDAFTSFMHQHPRFLSGINFTKLRLKPPFGSMPEH